MEELAALVHDCWQAVHDLGGEPERIINGALAVAATAIARYSPDESTRSRAKSALLAAGLSEASEAIAPSTDDAADSGR